MWRIMSHLRVERHAKHMKSYIYIMPGHDFLRWYHISYFVGCDEVCATRDKKNILNAVLNDTWLLMEGTRTWIVILMIRSGLGAEGDQLGSNRIIIISHTHKEEAFCSRSSSAQHQWVWSGNSSTILLENRSECRHKPNTLWLVVALKGRTRHRADVQRKSRPDCGH